MNDTFLLIITALCSGLIATGVTIFWQKTNQKKEAKRRIFTTLMSKRYEIPAEESVEALNMIDVVFYESPKVRTAWKNFVDATDLPDSPNRDQTVQDKHLKLLEVMAEDIGYKKIKWDEIKHYYYPIGLSSKKQDETTLRKVQISAAIAQLNSANGQSDGANANKDT